MGVRSYQHLSPLFGLWGPEGAAQEGRGPVVGPAGGRVEGAGATASGLTGCRAEGTPWTTHTPVCSGGGKSVTYGHPRQWGVTVAGLPPVASALL